ncbi:hypothetical protein RND81_04G183400 [Saponaria officinalis]|uniref:Uncharacterized protein n=1 Tax=Saponaria officinalis TaxID=3572 RepID=A0AAW1LFC0_SAPOF
MKTVKMLELVQNREKYGAAYIPCLIYNATGDTIRLEIYCEISGTAAAYVSPSPYPMLIMNGQWGAYLVAAGGAVVYVAKNKDGVEYQVVYSYVASPSPILPLPSAVSSSCCQWRTQNFLSGGAKFFFSLN